jgi:hypothetical protein
MGRPYKPVASQYNPINCPAILQPLALGSPSVLPDLRQQLAHSVGMAKLKGTPRALSLQHERLSSARHQLSSNLGEHFCPRSRPAGKLIALTDNRSLL